METIDRVGSGQTRARYPDGEGYVERDGVRVHYEVFGSGEPTVLLLPTWSIVHSRAWKMQVPYLARHCRVITFDGRGNGLSDRPEEPEAYAEAEFAADALAVLDATETDTGRSSSATRWARSAGCCSRPTTRSASRAPSSSARRCRSRPRRRGRGR